jgi:hypothetical protein
MKPIWSLLAFSSVKPALCHLIGEHTLRSERHGQRLSIAVRCFSRFGLVGSGLLVLGNDGQFTALFCDEEGRV